MSNIDLRGNPIAIDKIDRYGNVLETYSTIKDAAAQNFVSEKFIWGRCRKKIQKEFSLGFSFRYSEGGRYVMTEKILELIKDGYSIEFMCGVLPYTVSIKMQKGDFVCWREAQIDKIELAYASEEQIIFKLIDEMVEAFEHRRDR